MIKPLQPEITAVTAELSEQAVTDFPITERTRVRRRANRATYERELIHSMLDEALIASVAVAIDGQPHVQPMIHVRDGDRLILHGLATNRLLSAIAAGAQTCINVAIIDAMVLARRAEDHSMHYRSATVYGRGTLVEDDSEKQRFMEQVFNHLVKTQRLQHLPPLPSNYLQGTMVVTVPIDEAVGKVNQGLPTDDGPEDIWSGIVPLQIQYLEPVPDARTTLERTTVGAPRN